MRTRIAIFASIVFALLALTHGFVWATWISFQGGMYGAAWQWTLAGLTVVFIPATIASTRQSNVLLRLIYRVSAIWLGMLSFLFFAAIACWLIAGASALAGFPLNHALTATVLCGAALAAGVAAVVNASIIRITPVTIKLRGLPDAWRGRRAALVSDLHIGNVRGKAFVQRIVRKIQVLKPEVAFIAGDHFDGTHTDHADVTSPWSPLAGETKVFFATGNHEEFHHRAAFVDAIRAAGIQVLENSMAVVDGMQIVGVNDQDASDPESLRQALQAAQFDAEGASILLSHQPKHLAVVEEAGISLQLSGHTHGGQFWPWTKIARKVHGAYNRGLNQKGRLQVFTSCGVGTWGPPMRLGTRSEIVLLRFESAASSGD